MATGYSLQHIETFEFSETKDLVPESHSLSKLRAEIELLNREMFTDLLTDLKNLYDSYSVNSGDVELTRIKDELRPFWEHYISQMLRLRDIQRVEAIPFSDPASNRELPRSVPEVYEHIRGASGGELGSTEVDIEHPRSRKQSTSSKTESKKRLAGLRAMQKSEQAHYQAGVYRAILDLNTP